LTLVTYLSTVEVDGEGDLVTTTARDELADIKELARSVARARIAPFAADVDENPRFPGGRVRLNATLKSVETLPKGGVQATVDAVIELEGGTRPAVVAEVVYWFSE
jgi:hypothetical protein